MVRDKIMTIPETTLTKIPNPEKEDQNKTNTPETKLVTKTKTKEKKKQEIHELPTDKEKVRKITRWSAGNNTVQTDTTKPNFHQFTASSDTLTPIEKTLHKFGTTSFCRPPMPVLTTNA